MIAPTPPPVPLGRAIELGDYLRRSPLRFGEPPGFKEWLHFAVVDRDLHLLVNFSVADAAACAEGDSREVARLVLLVRDRDGWHGGTVSPPWGDVDLVGGTIDARLGGSRVRWCSGVFAIELDEPSLGIVGALRLHPVAHPSIVQNFPIGADRRMHWFTLPRLWCAGTLVHAGRTHVLHGAPAYHDHNWGTFSWGGDYSWTWGFALPGTLAQPWSVVFLGMHDRLGHRADVRGAFVWRHAGERRLFRDRDVEITATGVWHPDRVHKVPGIMAFLVPGTATAVPARLVVEARGRGDELRAEFRPHDVAQVIVPNDADAGCTVLSEAAGEIAVEGRIGGERFGFVAPTVVEFLGG